MQDIGIISKNRVALTHNPEMPAALHRGLLLQRGEARGVVCRVIKIEERLAHRAEIARREIRDTVEANLFACPSLHMSIDEHAKGI